MSSLNQPVSMLQTQASDRTYRLIRIAMIIVALYAIVDVLIRNTLGILPHMSSIAGAWKELLILGLYWLLYMKKKAQGTIRWHVSRLHYMILFTFLATIVSIIGNFLTHGASSYDIIHNNWVTVHESFPVIFDGIRTLLEPTLYFFVLISLIEDEETLLEMANLMIASAVVISIYGIYQHFFVKTPSSWVYADKEGGATRVFSTFIGPNSLGGYLVLMTPLALSFAFHSRNRYDRVLYGLATAIMLIALIFTLSRGAWIGFLAGVVFYIVATKRWKLLIVLLLGLLAIGIFMPSLAHRLTLVFTSAYLQKAQHGGRLQFWYRAFVIWKNRPITGTGIGLVGDSVAVVNKVPGSTWIDNQYVQLLAETGILGLGTYIAMLFTPVLKAWKWISNTKQHDSFLFALNAGLAAAIFGMIVENVTAAIFDTITDISYFWVMIAMLYVGIRLSKKNV